jgi:tetratricopeptide (TPR) repeat protein
MARASLLCILALTVAACATSSPRRAALTEAELLSGAAIAVAPAPAPISREDAFFLDEEMRAFVAAQIGDSRAQEVILHKLLAGMKDIGLLSLDYTPSTTRTARATFHERRGNCLSFTMLFVALAREAGLQTTFQIVDVPPTWVNESDLVVIGNHINAWVDLPGTDYIVDFNFMDYSSQHSRRDVTDGHALALFYNNLGAEALIRKEYDLSFRYFRQALATEPRVAGAWTNLGLLYSRLGRYEHAEAAYLQALAADSRDRTALTNLASLHTALGNQELAEAYRERIRGYQQRNPYYHYAIARDAFGQRRFEDALAALKRAVRLKRDDPEFYYLQGLVHLELGQRPSAATSFIRARDHAGAGETRDEYDARIRALAQESL